MVLDLNGDPMLAYVWVNPSGTKQNPPDSDTSIYFVSWNRSTNSYNAPVKVAVTGNVAALDDYFDFAYPLALARDPVNNTLGIAYRSYSANGNTAYVNIAFSTNDGQTWGSQQLVSSPVATNDYGYIDLALYSGAVYEMYYVQTTGPLELATGTETTAASTWSIQHADQVTGYPDVLGFYSLALDSTGTPAVVITRTAAGGTGTVPTYFWRPIANTIAEVMNDNGFGEGGDGDYNNYAVRLTFYGTEPIIVYNGARNNSFNNNMQVWLASSTTGAAGTWTVNNVAANDDADGIGAPFGIAAGSVGQVAVAATISTSNGSGCGEQTSIDLALTTNLGSTWSVCGMGGATSPNITSLYPTVRYGVNDGLFISFVDPDVGDPLPSGVYVWSQYANGRCTYSLATNSQAMGPAASSYSFVINAGTGCSWVNYSNASWLTIPSGASGSGMATITFAAAANTSNSPQVGTLTVAGITYTVTQAAGPLSEFFAGEDSLGSGVYYLQFPNGNLFGYYNLTNFPIFYHYDMGFEAFVDGGNGAAYFYDFASGHWWYTSATSFPSLYDFTLNTWIYYFPNTQSPGHYTTNPRYFVILATGQIFTM
jgi:hypothetical protein